MKKLILLIGLFSFLESNAQLTNTVPTSGPVGIGTASPVPGNQLTVNGNARILSSMTIDGVLLIDGQTIMQNVVRMPGILEYAGGIGDFEILVIDSTGHLTRGTAREIMIGLMALPAEIDYCLGLDTQSPQWFSGLYKIFSPCPEVKVGIGTSNPLHQLSVPVGVTYVRKFLAGNGIASTDALINGFLESPTADLLRLGYKNGALAEEIRFTIANNGNATTIGDYIAEGGLKVQSNSAIGGLINEQVKLGVFNDNKDVALLVQSNHTADHKFGIKTVVDRTTTRAFVVHNSTIGKDVFRVLGDGRVWATEITVAIMDNFPDYVFGDNYKLMSLKEVQKFVQLNKHLPDFDAGSQYEERGIDLAEIQLKQMEKIENIYLYLFEMNDRLEQLENENAALRNEVVNLKSN